MNSKLNNRYFKYLLLVILVVAYFLFFRKSNSSGKLNNVENVDHQDLDFSHGHLYFTKHARCRMNCRHIDETEINEVLNDGEINYRKSEVDATPCPKYAIEGMTHDHQHIRIIVGDCKTEVSIITVIDLEHEFECDCK